MVMAPAARAPRSRPPAPRASGRRYAARGRSAGDRGSRRRRSRGSGARPRPPAPGSAGAARPRRRPRARRCIRRRVRSAEERGAPGRASRARRPARTCASSMHWSSPAGSSGFRVLALASLDVLHLLAELLHLRLLTEHQVRDLAVTRLGAGGIELALDLLEQELDPLADRAALAERRGERAQVRFEAYQLLGHVAPVGEHGDLLAHPAATEPGAAP